MIAFLLLCHCCTSTFPLNKFPMRFAPDLDLHLEGWAICLRRERPGDVDSSTRYFLKLKAVENSCNRNEQISDANIIADTDPPSCDLIKSARSNQFTLGNLAYQSQSLGALLAVCPDPHQESVRARSVLVHRIRRGSLRSPSDCK